MTCNGEIQGGCPRPQENSKVRSTKIHHSWQSWRSTRSSGAVLHICTCSKPRPVQYAVQGFGGADKSVNPMQGLLSCRDRKFGIVVGALLLGGLFIARISGWQAGLQAPFSLRHASGMVSAVSPVIHACQAFVIARSDPHVLCSKASIGDCPCLLAASIPHVPRFRQLNA